VPERDGILQLIGLAARAGALVTGTERVREALRGNSVRFVLLARDGTGSRRDELLAALSAQRIPHAVRYDRAELGAATGRAPLAAIGITVEPLATRLNALLEEAAAQPRRDC
jgi:ribosomal protein L7Ae-like RNA K-turn-binding protein